MNTIAHYFFPMTFLLAIIVSVVGSITYFFPPKKINHLYGYRTQNSMKNQSNWDFAQRYSSIKLMQVALFLITFSWVQHELQFSESKSLISSLIVVLLSVAFVLLMTENALQKKQL